jgi:hypothetical protein
MTAENRWQKYREWVIVIVAIGIIVVLTAWFLQLAPQYIPRFLFDSLIGIIVGLIFITLLILFPKYRVRLREFLMNYRARTQKTSFYRYAMLFNAVMLTILIVFSFVLAYNPGILHSAGYVPYAFVALFIVFLIAAIIFIAALLKVLRKWGLILIIIGVVIAILRLIFR